MKTRYRKLIGIERADEVRHLPRGGLPPLIEPRHRHQAAPTLKRRAKSGLFRHRVATGVDHLRAERRILGPGRDQAPTQERKFTITLGMDSDDGEILGRRRIKRPSEQVAAAPLEIPGPLDVGFCLGDVSTAHGDDYIGCPPTAGYGQEETVVLTSPTVGSSAIAVDGAPTYESPE